MEIDIQQTCQPPRGKNIEILNLKLGKVVTCTDQVEKAVRCAKFPACYKWRIILKLASRHLHQAGVKRVGAFPPPYPPPLFAPATQATANMHTVGDQLLAVILKCEI